MRSERRPILAVRRRLEIDPLRALQGAIYSQITLNASQKKAFGQVNVLGVLCPLSENNNFTFQGWELKWVEQMLGNGKKTYQKGGKRGGILTLQ